MQHISLGNIEEATFRANPDYELMLFDRLPSEQQELLGNFRSDPDFYGILRPRRSGLSIKAVCRDTALLYFTLREAGRLPAYVKIRFGRDCKRAIAELVLDGVLEIEQDGRFVSGADASGLICVEDYWETASGKVARLSVAALKYAQALEINDSLKLSARLYLYNRLPLSARWKRMFPTREAVMEHLGIAAGGGNSGLLEKHWTRVAMPASNDWWLMWRSRRRPRSEFQQAPLGYKLYISPGCEFVAEAFRATAGLLAQSQAASFKVGNDVYGMLRPDKMVAYFRSLEDLQEASEQLRRELEGCPAHGVPFTSEITDDGLLSWGMDPPGQEPVPVWQEHESWRLWVTNRLAVAMLVAKAAESGTVEPWRFALERLRLEGVEPRSWTPTQTIWRERMAEA